MTAPSPAARRGGPHVEKNVSFIVPAYNVQSCLGQCLDSFVRGQGSPRRDFEVLIVDDGSSDNTAAIAEEYAQSRPGIFRCLRKTNGGHGSVINAAVPIAAGKYIKIIDADDWIEPDSLAPYLDALAASDADVIVTNFRTHNQATGRVKAWKTRNAPVGPIGMEELMRRWNDFAPCLTFHGLTYLRSFYLRSGLKLSEGIFYEDAEYSTVPLCRANSVLILDQYLYCYRTGVAGQSVSDANRIARLADLESVLRRLCAYAGTERRAMTEPMRSCCLKRIAAVARSYFVTPLLRFPDRKAGRDRAASFYAFLAAATPDVAAATAKRYRILWLLNCVGPHYTALARWTDSLLFDRFKRLL